MKQFLEGKMNAPDEVSGSQEDNSTNEGLLWSLNNSGIIIKDIIKVCNSFYLGYFGFILLSDVAKFYFV